MASAGPWTRDDGRWTLQRSRRSGQAIVEYLIVAGAIIAVIVSLSGLINARGAALIDRAGQELMSPSATADGLMP